MDPYQVAMIQSEINVVVRPEQRDELVQKNLSRMLELLDWVFLRIGSVKLAMTPEYSLMGQYRPRSVDEWIEIALPLSNNYVDQAAEKAAERDCFIQLHFLEKHPAFPGRFFNTSVLISPQKEIVLTYRKHNGPNNLNTTYTGPADVYDEFVRVFGEDALFPVADTPLGKIGIMVCGDILYPEMSRVLALKGAEVILHPTAEPFSQQLEGWDALRRARAVENVVYFLSTNAGAFLGSNRPRSGYAGRSQAYGPMGEPLMFVPESGEAIVTVTVDPDRLRLLRAGTGSGGHSHNTMAQIRSDLFAPYYASAKRFPNNAFLDRPIEAVADARAIAQTVIDRLVADGLQVLPESRRAGAQSSAVPAR